MIELKFDKLSRLIPAIIQDFKTNEVLMLGFMNKEAWEKTLETGRVYFFSRTRSNLWMKGETSGNIQEVKEMYLNCDKNSLLLKVDQNGGAACHNGYKSCFYRRINKNIFEIVGLKVFNPEDKYGNT